MDRRREAEVIIVGGGFAGTTLVRSLARRLSPGVRLTLVSEESYTTFNPLLAEAVGASIFPEHVVAPLREIVRPGANRRFIMGRVGRIDAAARRLSCSTLGGEIDLAFDHLVLAFGNRASLDLVPGMSAHALPLKTVGDALEIRNAVLRRAARIELESDPALRRMLGHFVVIGGGFSGVEVAGELADYLAGLRRYYPGIADGELQVTILHDQERLLPELPAVLGEAAAASMRARGVAVRLHARAGRIDHDAVTLTSGEIIPAGTAVCTIGTRANALVASSGLPAERGRVVVNKDLSVAGHPGVWALGDCALVPNGHDGKFSPPTAQFAVRQGHLLADNLLAAMDGRPTRAFAYRSRGSMASVGHLKGVADLRGLAVRGLAAWLLWRAYYLAQMPTLRRRLRLFVEWTWGMLFPPDITHLRFTPSRQVIDAEREGSKP